MIGEMFIEGQQVDVSTDFSTLLNFEIDDIKSIGEKSSTWSKEIILPGTGRNNKIFNFVFDVTRMTLHNPGNPNVLTNYNAAKSARCIIFQGNIQVFKGVIRIIRIIELNGVIEYETQVVGELGGLVAALGNRKLEDIDWTPFLANYSLDYTEAEIVNSWDGIGSGDGIYYPLIDYGNFSANKHDWDYRTFRPALYVKDYIDKIFYHSSGYSYVCALFDTARFKRLIVPYNQKTLTRLSNLLGSFTKTSDETLSASDKIVFQSVSGGFTPNGTNDQFTYTGTATVGFRIVLSLSALFIADHEFTIRFARYDSGGTIIQSDIILGGTSGTSLGLTYDEYFSGVLIPGEKISITTASSSGVQISSGATFQLLTDAVVPVPMTLGQTLTLSDIVPRGILQKDFFSSILKLFNLYVQEDKFDEKKLNITPYVDFYDTNPANAIDWTYKLDRSMAKKLTPMSELNSRYYEFKYKDDSDFYSDQYKKRYNESYGSRTYDSAYEFANEKSSVELIFAGTPLVGYAGEEKVYSTIFKRSGNTIGSGEENVDSVIRILQAKKITGVTGWNLKDAASVLNAYTKYGYAGHLDDPDAPSDDINFGVPKEIFFTLVSGALNVNQFNVYYSPYFAEITDPDSKLLEATFRLNEKDIYNLDFSKLIYIDGSLWRLKKIEDYNASTPDTCKCTFLRVINLLY